LSSGVLLFLLAAAPAQADEQAGLPLLVHEDFEKGADRWQPTDPKAWRIVETDRGKVYNQFAQSKYNPPYNSPHNISLLKDVLVGDFVLTAVDKTFLWGQVGLGSFDDHGNWDDVKLYGTKVEKPK
jgi:hypothetical protein